MMSERRLFWLLVAGLFFGLIYLLSDVLMPFVFCAALAYVLDPLVDKFEDWGLSRGSSTSIVFVLCLLLFVAELLLILPLLINQFIALSQTLPKIFQWLQNNLDQGLGSISPLIDDLLITFGLESVENLQLDLIQQSREWLKTFTEGLVQTVTRSLKLLSTKVGAIGSSLSLMLIAPIILFYLLRDWDSMTGSVMRLVPHSKVSMARTLGFRINIAIAGFLRGQLLVMLALGLIYGIGLSIIGLPFGFSLGLMAGILSFIPYAGTLIGLLLSVIVSLVEFGALTHLAMVLGVFGFGQVLESVWLTPKLIGENINLHPVWVIFALLACGSLFGFIGLLIAIPLLAVLSVLVRFALQQYQDSDYYRDAS